MDLIVQEAFGGLIEGLAVQALWTAYPRTTSWFLLVGGVLLALLFVALVMSPSKEAQRPVSMRVFGLAFVGVFAFSAWFGGWYLFGGGEQWVKRHCAWSMGEITCDPRR